MQFKNKALLALKMLLISLGLSTNLYAQCQIRELSTPRNSKASMVIPCAGYLTHITPDDEVGTTIQRNGIEHVGYLCNQVEANSELGRLGFPMSARSCSSIPQSTQNGFACNPDDDSLIARQGNADAQCRNLDNVRIPVRSGDVVTLWRSASANLGGNPSVIFTPYKAPGQSNIPQCSDTKDNDKDGTTDFYEESGLAGSFTFASCAEIRTFLNSFPELSKISDQSQDLGCARSDTATRNEICRRAGYKRVVSYKTGRWHSCHDNTIGKWDSSANDIVIQNACVAGNINLDSLVCDTRVTECSDGKDNDGDGQVDLDDSGCENQLDLSEKNHDSGCNSPTDTNENDGNSGSSPECSDGIDNDGDGKIDYSGVRNCENLLVNGDFSQGNLGYSSQYSYINLNSCGSKETPTEGQYSITDNPGKCHPGFFQGSGNNLAIFNGAGFAPSSFLCQTVSVERYTDYTFSVSERIIGPDGTVAPSQWGAPISWTINNQTVIAKKLLTVSLWDTRSGSWNSGNSTTAKICGLNHYTTRSGNDWGIDDLRFVKSDTSCNIDPDPNCTSPNDDSEGSDSNSAPQCRDGKDNDNDGKVDNFDPGCWANTNDPSTYNNDGNDESSDNNAALAKPVITAPANNSSFQGNAKPTITWKSVAGADYYDIWGRLVSDSGVTITDQIFRNEHVNGTSYLPWKDLPIGKYNVWVRAYSNSGKFSVWSAPVTFSLVPAVDHTQCNDNVDNDNDGKKDAADPGCWDDQNKSATYNPNLNNEAADNQAILSKPVVTYPINGSTISSGNKRPEFRWTSVTGADYYDLWVDEIAMDAKSTIRREFIRQKSLSGTTFVPSKDLTDGKYRVWVQAFRNSGAPKGSGWSVASTFIIANGSSAPQCSDGLDNDGDGLIDFNGKSACSNLIVNGDFEQGNTGFTTQYVNLGVNEGNTCKIGKPHLPIENQILIADSPNVCHGIYEGDFSRGKLLIINSAQTSKNFWCQKVTVTKNSDYELKVSMRSAVTIDNQPNRIQWTINGNAVSNEIQTKKVFTDYSFNWSSGNSTTANICGKTLDTSRETLDTVVDDIEFSQVGGACNIGADPDCSGPNDNTEGTGAIHECSDGQDNDGDQKVDRLDPGCWTNQSDSSTYDPNLNNEGADNTGTALNQPIITAPTKGQVLADKTPIFKWKSVAGADYYDLWVRRLDLSSDTIITDQIVRNKHVVGNWLTPDSDLPGGRYTVWVRAYSNSGASSIWSIGIMFVISDPSNPQCSDGSDNDGDGVIDEKDPGCWRDHRDPWSYHPGCDDENSEPVKVTYMVEPVDNLSTNNQRPWFSWDAVTGAEKYQIWINKFPSTGAQTNYLIVDGITATNYMTPTNIPAGRYKVWVRAYTGDIAAGTGTRGAWSTPRTFTITGNNGDGSGSKRQCNDGIDNDGDGVTDTDDPGCYGDPNGADESAATTECQDGIDNDGDKKIDGSDPQCLFQTDNSENS